MLKKVSFIALFFFSSLFFVSFASAQVPSSCLKKNGKINCKNPHCERYCYDRDDDFRDRDYKKQDKRKHKDKVIIEREVVYVPQPVVVEPQRPSIVITPPSIHVAGPSVVVDSRVSEPPRARMPSPDFYEAEIHRIKLENDALSNDLEYELQRIEISYRSCRYWNHKKKECNKDYKAAKAIERRIDANKAAIERNKELQRKSMRQYRR